MTWEEGGLQYLQGLRISINTRPPKKKRIVEFETANDLKVAVEKLDGREFKGSRVNCIADVRTLGALESRKRKVLMIVLPDSTL